MYYEIFMDISSALVRLGMRHGQGVLQGNWDQRGQLNIPGPLYCADVDNSGPGPAEAPNNVFIDNRGFPFIFRQPTNAFGLRQVMLAADNDPFSAYSADGDQHWNRSEIREWWGQRHDLEAQIATLRTVYLDSSREVYGYLAALDRWQAYLEDGMELYLRVYAFFLEEGRVPQDSDSLPSL
jgi:hypothetical protein